MALPHAHTKRKYHLQTKATTLENPLLNDQERAMLYELDQSFMDTEDESTSSARLENCLKNCEVHCCLDKGVLSLVATFFVTVIGIALVVLAMQEDLPAWVDKLGRYVLSAGVLGLASGGTNWLAVFGLFYRVPGFIGSGVFYRQHKEIRNIIKMIVLQMIFDSKHLEDYILKKISHFSSNVQVVDNISAALSSPEAERIIEERMDSLYVQPEGQYLQTLGLSKLKLRPLIKPAILSLCAETAPMVLGTVGIPKKNEGISVPQFREEMDRYLSWRAEAVTDRAIGALMRRHMFQHLSWVVVWGSVFGLLTGVVVQALQLSLNLNVLLRS